MAEEANTDKFFNSKRFYVKLVWVGIVALVVVLLIRKFRDQNEA